MYLKGILEIELRTKRLLMAKKKILLLSDDLRMNSGVGTMSREFVLTVFDLFI